MELVSSLASELAWAHCFGTGTAEAELEGTASTAAVAAAVAEAAVEAGAEGRSSREPGIAVVGNSEEP